MIIGSAWLKDSKDGKKYMSCVIELPFIGKINFAMFKVDDKKSENSPDYSIVWSAPRKAEEGSGKPFNDKDIPF